MKRGKNICKAPKNIKITSPSGSEREFYLTRFALFWHERKFQIYYEYDLVLLLNE